MLNYSVFLEAKAKQQTHKTKMATVELKAPKWRQTTENSSRLHQNAALGNCHYGRHNYSQFCCHY